MLLGFILMVIPALCPPPPGCTKTSQGPIQYNTTSSSNESCVCAEDLSGKMKRIMHSQGSSAGVGRPWSPATTTAHHPTCGAHTAPNGPATIRTSVATCTPHIDHQCHRLHNYCNHHASAAGDNNQHQPPPMFAAAWLAIPSACATLPHACYLPCALHIC